jgi:MinD-like ATPase involved in chromosome partitioning or flagellar assembly
VSASDSNGGDEVSPDPHERPTAPPAQAGDGWLVGALSAEALLTVAPAGRPEDTATDDAVPGEDEPNRDDGPSDNRPSDDRQADDEAPEADAHAPVVSAEPDPVPMVESGDGPDGVDLAAEPAVAGDGSEARDDADDGAVRVPAAVGPPAAAGERAAADRPTTTGSATAADQPQRRGAEQLREEAIVRSRPTGPHGGWRGALYTLTGGRLNVGASLAEQQRDEQVRRIRRPIQGAHHIAVSSIKGGVGKTTVAACLGLVLAEYRGDRVIALDAHPTAGTLAERVTGRPKASVRDMLAVIDTLRSFTDVSRYTSLAGRLQVLASEQDPASRTAFDRDEYRRVTALLGRFYDIVITDSGPGLVHSAMEGTLALADSLVIVGAPTADGASRADKTLDWLVVHGHAERVADAVVVLTCDRSAKHLDIERVRRHFAGRVRAVVQVPFDPHLAPGARIELDRLRPATHDAFLTLAGHLADRFPPPTVPMGSVPALGMSRPSPFATRASSATGS